MRRHAAQDAGSIWPGPPAFVVHAAADVAAVLGLGRPAALISAPGAAAYLGHEGFLALLAAGGWRPGLAPALLDCGHGAGHAWAALAAGVPAVVLAPCPALAALSARFPGRVMWARPPARDLAEWNPARGSAWLLAWIGQSEA
ncbi:MAG: hypothetical protein RMK64_02995 [Rhodovarius sp.]|nr:hypothetical protein [Rhodovarius sp.]MDW8313915.1 hypothetical protein [Rhodovarius sp.]